MALGRTAPPASEGIWMPQRKFPHLIKVWTKSIIKTGKEGISIEKRYEKLRAKYRIDKDNILISRWPKEAQLDLIRLAHEAREQRKLFLEHLKEVEFAFTFTVNPIIYLGSFFEGGIARAKKEEEDYLRAIDESLAAIKRSDEILARRELEEIKAEYR